MKRKEGSKQSEGVPGLQIAENQNLGMPNPNRHSNLIYLFTVLCEIVNKRYIKLSSYNFQWRF